jgi:hypothetical protein
MLLVLALGVGCSEADGMSPAPITPAADLDTPTSGSSWQWTCG